MTDTDHLIVTDRTTAAYWDMVLMDAVAEWLLKEKAKHSAHFDHVAWMGVTANNDERLAVESQEDRRLNPG